MQPTLTTERLVLRPFMPMDAEAVHRLASNRAIADTTISVPHPLERSVVAAWFQAYADAFAEGRGAYYAVTEAEGGALAGQIGLRGIEPEHGQAELTFWIGEPFWGRGYASEAARRMVHYGFGVLRLNRIYACHMVRNPASGRVLAKAGMRQEGVLRQRARKWGVYEDVVLQAVLREDLPGSR
ncbi:MAG: GNAT family N-acetyltransferase [Rhodothermales bacterium]|nr:GNAT family N-acetyltransferase [Rhodothermales bacterium]